MNFFKINARPGKVTTILLSASLFVLSVVAYAWTAHVRHKENPQDKVVPTFEEMGEGFYRTAFEEDRKVMFANLPDECEVRIYTVAGDLVDQFDHTADYNGGDIRWFDTYSDTSNTRFSGGEHGWDLLSKDNQIIARGIYLFSVKDLSSGKIFKGKFVVIK